MPIHSPGLEKKTMKIKINHTFFMGEINIHNTFLWEKDENDEKQIVFI